MLAPTDVNMRCFLSLQIKFKEKVTEGTNLESFEILQSTECRLINNYSMSARWI